MTTNNQKDVNLVIKAQDQSKATLQGVATSIEAISAALNKQVEAAKNGIVKSGELKDTLSKLQKAQAELSREQGLIQYYEKLAARLDETKKKAADTGATYAKAAQDFAKLEEPTARQTAALTKMESAVTRANVAVEKATANLTTQVTKLNAAGIETDHLDSAMVKINATAEQTGAAIAVTSKALENYNQNLRETREAAQVAATAEQALLAQRTQAAAEAEQLQDEASKRAAARRVEDAKFAGAAVQGAAIVERDARMRVEQEYSDWWNGELKRREQEFVGEEMKQVIDTETSVEQRKRVEQEYSDWWNAALKERTAAEITSAQQRSEAERAAAEQATAAQKRYDAALKDFNQTLGRTNEGSRESLSWYQRVRGEVIALATAYVGFMGTIGLAKGAIDSFVDKQAAENRLAIVVGNDQAAIAKEWDYVHAQAERLGIGITQLADSYSRFAIAAKNGNLTLDQTKFAFERITEVMRVNHASSDAIAGSFVQLEQMLSKNKVQMDDLRQASNWIPGLEGMMARGLGMVNVEQLFAAMKKGSVDAKAAILSLAEEMERQYADRLPSALKSLQAEQGRFNTSVSDFERLIAESGFADAYTQLLQKLQTFFKSDDGKRFAKDISDAFSEVVKQLGGLQGAAGAIEGLIRLFGDVLKVVSFLTDQGRLLGDILEIAIGVKIYSSLSGLVTGLTAASIKMTELKVAAALAGPQIEATAVATSLLTKALMAVQWALAAVAAFMAGWEIGTILRDKFEIVKKTGDTVTTYLIYTFKIAVAEIGNMWDLLTGKVGDGAGRMMRNLQRIGLQSPDVPDDIRKSALADLDKQDADAADKLKSGKSNDQAQQLRSERDSLIRDIQSGKYYQDNTGTSGSPQTAQQKDALDYINAQQKKLNDILSERQKILDGIRDKWKAQSITQEAAEKQATAAFASFGPKLKALQKDTNAGAQVFGSNMPVDKWQGLSSRMSAAAGVYDPNLTPNNDKLLKQQESAAESLQRQFANLNAQIDKNDQDVNKSYDTLLNERVAATKTAYDRIAQDIAKYQKIGGTTVKDVDGSNMTLTDLKARLSAMQEIDAIQAKQKLATQELAKEETAVNQAIQERTDRFKAVTDQVANGTLSAAEGFRQIQQISNDLNPKIKELANNAQNFANRIRGSGAVSDTALNAYGAKMGRASDSASDSSATGAAAKAAMDAYKAQEKDLNDIIAERNDLVQTQNALVKQGLETQGDAQKTIEKAYGDSKPKIQSDINSLRDALNAMHDAGQITDTTFSNLSGKLDLVQVQTQSVNATMTKLRDTIETGFASGVSKAFDSLADSIAGLIDNTKSWGDVWKDVGNIARQFFADFLKDIANALIKQQALLVGQQISGFVGGLFSSGAATSSTSSAASSVATWEAHTGGVSGSVGNVSRPASASWFQNAPRYHTGTVVGLKPDEQAAILQKGEEVLTKQDPRNALNGGMTSGAAQPAPGQRIVNVLHPDLFQDYMNSSAGEDVHLNVIRRNASGIKQILAEA